jgi:hypothetical protein
LFWSSSAPHQQHSLADSSCGGDVFCFTRRESHYSLLQSVSTDWTWSEEEDAANCNPVLLCCSESHRTESQRGSTEFTWLRRGALSLASWFAQQTSTCSSVCIKPHSPLTSQWASSNQDDKNIVCYC